MKTITFTPHEDIKSLPADFVAKWAVALRSSVQHKGRLCNKDDTAHCCLGVAARMEGATFSQYGGDQLPRQKYALLSNYAFTVMIAHSSTRPVRYSSGTLFLSTHLADPLNDKYLTHPQIADLLEGKSVTIEVAE